MFSICFYFYVYFSLSFNFCNFDVFLVNLLLFFFKIKIIINKKVDMFKKENK